MALSSAFCCCIQKATAGAHLYEMKTMLQTARNTIWNGPHVIWFDHSPPYINSSLATLCPSLRLPYFSFEFKPMSFDLRVFNFLWEPFIHESCNAVPDLHNGTRSHQAKSHRENYTKRLKKMVILPKYYSLLHNFLLLNRYDGYCGHGCCTSWAYKTNAYYLCLQSATWFGRFACVARAKRR